MSDGLHGLIGPPPQSCRRPDESETPMWPTKGANQVIGWMGVHRMLHGGMPLLQHGRPPDEDGQGQDYEDDDDQQQQQQPQHSDNS